jgi:hypothetical protein
VVVKIATSDIGGVRLKVKGQCLLQCTKNQLRIVGLCFDLPYPNECVKFKVLSSLFGFFFFLFVFFFFFLPFYIINCVLF